MIKVNHFPVFEYWFCERPSPFSAALLVSFVQAKTPASKLLFRTKEVHTICISLSSDISTLHSNLEANVAYEIRRAAKENPKFVGDVPPQTFVEFYNEFARRKNLPPIKPSLFLARRPFLHIVGICTPEGYLVMHAYITDVTTKRVRLLHSANCLIDKTPSNERARIGRANRWLHWEAILHFKQLGFANYDLGGYALHTADTKLQGINAFKKGFGGDYVSEWNQNSWPLVFVQEIRGRLST